MGSEMCIRDRPITVPLIFPDSYAELPINRDRNTKTKNTFLIKLFELDLNMSPSPSLDMTPILALSSCR